MPNYFYYCPYCGTTQFQTNTTCIKCHSHITPVQSKYESEYYKNKSMKQYGDYMHWKDFLMNEISNNNLFSEEEYYRKQTNQEIETGVQNIFNKQDTNQNIPKCPTCGSTNIKNISSLKRITHAYAFGLFSKTAKSQFECNNCHYKW